MKKTILIALITGCIALAGSNAYSQENNSKYPPLDVSPMDMSYCPNHYTTSRNPEKLIARIIYSRPQKKGREIFGKLEPYGKVDRLGANQANELDVYSPVTIGGKELQPGRYTMYAIFNPDKWTIIISSKTDTWGAFSYDESKDVVRTNVPVQKMDKPLEALTMVFEKAANGSNLVIAWDTTEIELPLNY